MVESIEKKERTTITQTTPFQPTYWLTKPIIGPSMIAPMDPIPLTRLRGANRRKCTSVSFYSYLVTPAPWFCPYFSPTIIVIEPVSSESGPQLHAPASTSNTEQ